ncbi:hypothetical protein [Rhizobium sp. RU36D]|uniref:hypothetical protein n=1 Tax=Rhizobium sp. RU36D TaxID=1907415 RepID=UPI0009D8A61E|nr:hypothetical protein [Rhizobium sp. RU36D]SMC67445.1 hypothetical protein SAMN05880593_104174 [Rhizobium sp. RU36D]
MTIFQRRDVSPSPPQILQFISVGDYPSGSPDLICGVAARLLDFSGCYGEAAATARRGWRSLLAGSTEVSAVPLWVGLHRVEDEEEIALDIAWALEMGAEGVALAGARSGADLQYLHVLLDVAEAEGSAAIRLSILALIGDNSQGLLAAGSFAGKSDRLMALGWNGGLLAQALGDELPPSASLITSVRATVRLAAAAADVAAVDCACGSSLEDAASRGWMPEPGFEWVLVHPSAPSTDT